MDNLKEILEQHKLWLQNKGGSRANLRRANLRRADLGGANLRHANLGGANLRHANLYGANLGGANLRRANLCDADLCDADLRGANLGGAIGNGRELKSLHCGTYDISYTKDIMQIGCQRHSIEDWFSFNDSQIASMDSKALTLWSKWKPILQEILKDA